MVTRPPSSPRPRSNQAGGLNRTLIYEAAWLHYERHVTQTQIAKMKGVNKATVSRWLKSARQDGIVSIELHPPGIEDLQVRLVSAFKLKHARVIPGMPVEPAPADGAVYRENYNRQMEELGKAAAAFYGPGLQGNTGLGLAGGRGVAAFGRSLVKYCSPVPLKIYSLGASSHEPFAFGATSVTAITAHALLTGFEERAARERAAGRSSAVPPVTGDALRLPTGPDGAAGKDALAKRYYDSIMDDMQHVIAGVGDIASSFVLNDEQKVMLPRDGAIGEVAYDVYGIGATPIRLKPTDAVFSFGIDRLRSLVADGREVTIICKDKIEAIYELLACKSRIVTGIVTDASTAKDLLERFDEAALAR